MSEALEASLQSLEAVSKRIGCPLDDASLATLSRWANLVMEWKKAAQLTGLRSAPAVVQELMEPALYALSLVQITGDMHIVDFGCGNGCTGVALALAARTGQWYLVDRDEKKLTFCRHALRECRISAVKAISVDTCGRMEVQANVMLMRAMPRTEQVRSEARRLLGRDSVVVRWAPEEDVPDVQAAAHCGNSGIWVVATPAECFT